MQCHRIDNFRQVSYSWVLMTSGGASSCGIHGFQVPRCTITYIGILEGDQGLVF